MPLGWEGGLRSDTREAVRGQCPTLDVIHLFVTGSTISIFCGYEQKASEREEGCSSVESSFQVVEIVEFHIGRF